MDEQVRQTRRIFLTQGTAAACGALSAAQVLAQDKPASPPVAAPPTKPLPPLYPVPPSQEPHLGSLAPFVRSQTPKEFSLSFTRAEFKELEEWKQQARKKIFDLLLYSPEKCDPRAEVVERKDRGDYIQEQIYFNTAPESRVPASLLIPKNAKLPAPAIVALHDHGGFYLWGREKLTEQSNDHPSMTTFKETFYGGKNIAVELVRQGYVVIVIDLFYWGERRLIYDNDPSDWRERPADISAERIVEFNRRSGANEQLVGRTLFAAGITWAGIICWDDIRTVDYLVSRPEVDPQRIGCVGLSVGGLRACHLTALDERVKAGVVVGWMASFPAQLEKHVRSTIGHTKLIPGLYRYLDYPDMASLAMPRALMVINGSRDGLFELNGVKSCFAKLKTCYEKAGIPEKLSTLLYDTPHEFNLEMQGEAWKWLRRWV